MQALIWRAFVDLDEGVGGGGGSDNIFVFVSPLKYLLWVLIEPGFGEVLPMNMQQMLSSKNKKKNGAILHSKCMAMS